MAVSQWQKNPDLLRKTIEFDFRDNRYRGTLVAPPKSEGPKPLVLVIHNYQGLKFFDEDVAEFMARSGYVGLAIDLYGDNVPSNERLWPDDPEKVMSFNRKCFEAMVQCDHDHEFFRSLLCNECKASIKKQKNYKQWYVKFACGMQFPDG